MRAQAHGVELVGPLVLDPRVDDVLREHAALEQPLVVVLQVVEHLFERARHLLDHRLLLGRQVVQVLVHRLRRLELVLDAVEAGHQHRAERQVRVARGSGVRNSSRFAPGVLEMTGIRMHAERFRWLYTRLIGASYPGTSRRYEFVVGLVNASSDGACASSPPM